MLRWIRGWPKTKKLKSLEPRSSNPINISSNPLKAPMFFSFHTIQNIEREMRSACFFPPLILIQAQISSNMFRVSAITIILQFCFTKRATSTNQKPRNKKSWTCFIIYIALHLWCMRRCKHLSDKHSRMISKSACIL